MPASRTRTTAHISSLCCAACEFRLHHNSHIFCCKVFQLKMMSLATVMVCSARNSSQVSFLTDYRMLPNRLVGREGMSEQAAATCGLCTASTRRSLISRDVSRDCMCAKV